MQEYFNDYPPDYVINQFTPDTYGICRFNRRGSGILLADKKAPECHDLKLDNNFSRARSMVLQYGLCNKWDWFVTLTLDKEKYDRYDLERFKVALSQFMQDRRKVYDNYQQVGDIGRLRYLFVPEMHHDGAWHMHGLLSGVPPIYLSKFVAGVHPDYLIRHEYVNWPDYSNNFGFVSLGRVRDSYSTVLYTVKYIDKSVKELADQQGKHLYFSSHGLKKAERVSDCYGSHPELDSLLNWHGQFCSTGMARGKDWVWASEFADIDEYIYPVSVPDDFDPVSIDPTYQYNIDDLIMMG
ncbi:MAG: hypothetical protein RR235_09035 [Oscillospiraceae bacterium]